MTWDDLANQGWAGIMEIYKCKFKCTLTFKSLDLIPGLIKVLDKDILLAYLISMTLLAA